MANSQVTVRDTQLEKQRLGFINLNLNALATTAVPDIVSGSVVEVGGSLYSFTSDESPSGWAGISNDNQVYIKLTPGTSSVTSSFVTTAPTYSDAKGGWYSGDDRYVAKVYKNASGEAVQKYVYPQDSEAGSVWDRLLDTIPWFTNRQTYTTAGNDTWTCPNDVHVIKAAIIGAGGGGGGARAQSDTGSNVWYAAGAGGGGGAVTISNIAVIPGKEYSITVGSGGAGGTGVGNGSNGGDSTAFSITAAGGAGGNYTRLHASQANATGTGGIGGVSPNEQYCAAGTNGGDGDRSETAQVDSGAGGSVRDLRSWPLQIDEWDSGGASVTTPASSSTTTTGLNGGDGCGGSGGAATAINSEINATGGDGGDGIVIIAY